eukprot:gene9659-biopygen12772
MDGRRRGVERSVAKAIPFRGNPPPRPPLPRSPNCRVHLPAPTRLRPPLLASIGHWDCLECAPPLSPARPAAVSAERRAGGIGLRQAAARARLRAIGALGMDEATDLKHLQSTKRERKRGEGRGGEGEAEAGGGAVTEMAVEARRWKGRWSDQ